MSNLTSLTPENLKRLQLQDNLPLQDNKVQGNKVQSNTVQNNHVQVIAADVLETKSWWDGTLFDRILLDAPCSATGVIRRHPDIKYLRSEKDIQNLVEIQKKMLSTLWPLLKPDGILLYATCSILPEENEQVVADFLKTVQDAYLIPEELPIGIKRDMGTQLLPGQNGTDGFYYARIGKKILHL